MLVRNLKMRILVIYCPRVNAPRVYTLEGPYLGVSSLELHMPGMYDQAFGVMMARNLKRSGLKKVQCFDASVKENCQNQEWF